MFLTEIELKKKKQALIEPVWVCLVGVFVFGFWVFFTWKRALTFCWLSALTGIGEAPGRLVVGCGHV